MRKVFAAVGVGLAVLLAVRGSFDEPTAPSAPPTTEAMAPAPPRAPVPVPAPDVRVGAGTAVRAPSLAARVKQLASSPKPEHAFSAFQILRQCKWAKEEERRYELTPQAQRPERESLVRAGVAGPPFVASSCGDLEPADFRDMLALAERAAQGAVPMAALYLADEGPWGDPMALYTRWEDPLVQQWRFRMIELTHLAARRGDVNSLGAIQAQYESGEGLIGELNPELALRYAIAKHRVHEEKTGRRIWGARWELEQMTAKVTPEQAARAKAAGEQLAREAVAPKQ